MQVRRCTCTWKDIEVFRNIVRSILAVEDLGHRIRTVSIPIRVPSFNFKIVGNGGEIVPIPTEESVG